MSLRPSLFWSSQLSVVDLSRVQGGSIGIEFKWAASEWWFGRMPIWERDLALEIAERINSEATTESEAIEIFEEMRRS